MLLRIIRNFWKDTPSVRLVAEDLVTAEKTLEQIIQELDEGMRKQFSEKFGEIQKEFDKAFKELFEKGKGTLELDEEQEIS